MDPQLAGATETQNPAWDQLHSSSFPFRIPRVLSRLDSSDNLGPAAAPSQGAAATITTTDTMHLKEKQHLDIILDNQYLTLKGTGPDVEPTRLSGHVALFLTEPTSIKEVTLQFRGKARIPMPASESLVGSTASIAYMVCNHDWSFLEGDKRHTRTLKAGRHSFPFQLEIGGSLPSSMSTHALGGASVAYKLRAVAVRPGLSHNLTYKAPVYILRSFTHEALEYQQTLEIENTWPDKLMYAILLPHKAWAAGDTLAAIVKFSPLAKGVNVQSILTTLCETTKVYARSGTQEDTRIVATERTDMNDVVLGENENNDIVTSIKLTIPPTLQRPTGLTTSAPVVPPPSRSHVHGAGGISLISVGNTTNHPLPSSSLASTVTPSHTLEPVSVSHRVRWNIFIHNEDGHISELRCSLPVCILDGQLLREARGFSVPTRRMLFAASGMGTLGDEALDRTFMPSGADETGPTLLPGLSVDIDEADRELPSYNAHVRDRVANMFLPETVTMRVSNPWVGRENDSSSPTTNTTVAGGNTSSTSTEHYYAESPVSTLGPGVVVDPLAMALAPTSSGSGQAGSSNPSSQPRSGRATPARTRSHQAMGAYVMSHLPHIPGSGESTPLDWVNSELLLSLSDQSLRSLGEPVHHAQHAGAPLQQLQSATSPPVGRWGSRAASRVPSRAPSPERERAGGSGTGSGSGSVDGHGHPRESSSSSHTGAAHAHERSSVRSLAGSFFKATMKPFTSLGLHHDGDNASFALSRNHPPSGTNPHHHSESTPPFPSTVGDTPQRQNCNPGPSTIASSSDAPAHIHSQPHPHTYSDLRSTTSLPNSAMYLSHPRSNSSHLPLSSMSPFSRPPSSGDLSSSITSGRALIHRVFTEVPDYSIASRGFIGGVPPLSSMRGLPSYEEAEAARGREDSRSGVLGRASGEADIVGDDRENHGNRGENDEDEDRDGDMDEGIQMRRGRTFHHI